MTKRLPFVKRAAMQTNGDGSVRTVTKRLRELNKDSSLSLRMTKGSLVRELSAKGA